MKLFSRINAPMQAAVSLLRSLLPVSEPAIGVDAPIGSLRRRLADEAASKALKALRRKGKRSDYQYQRATRSRWLVKAPALVIPTRSKEQRDRIVEMGRRLETRKANGLPFRQRDAARLVELMRKYRGKARGEIAA